MSNIETAKLLAKIGAILLIILGIAYILWNGVLDIIYYMSQGWIIDPWNFIEIGIGAVAVILGFLIFMMYLPMIDKNAKNAGMYILIFGVIGSFGSFWVGGVLCLIAGLLLILEESG